MDDFCDNQFCYIGGIAININDYEKSMGIPYDINGKLMIIKKGTKRAHHFARKANKNNKGNDSKGSWHKWWQKRVKIEHTEIEYKIDGNHHRADIVNTNGLIIEIQKSPINIQTIRKRENFYNIGLTEKYLQNSINFENIAKLPRSMIWLWDCSSVDITIDKQYNDIICFKWIKGSQFMLDAKERSFLDFNKRGLIEVLGIKTSSTPKVVGKIWSLYKFDCEFLKNCLSENVDTRTGYPKYKLKGEIKTIDWVKRNYLK